ncbi:Tryptophan-rich sensory protein [Hyphomicrobium sulfonivorans]|uniref:Tryptophan-rich sensory protein n=1 Tax=Hyphomicrobium sulfonivorans TaxID=121290 RepID=A0A109BI94_HYPSL|nr:TspO/MBR family protein [Hyphomicrobium sulfonivorans]KWT69277.1 Tryptophan-rich sensory protein [Hyphomicrobium sulfonivorans]
MKYLGLLVFVLLVAGAAYTGSTYLPGPFYAALEKPVWTPPDDVFMPVWMVLYAMIALAGWIAWRAQGFGPLLWLWLLQLGLNTAWSYFMFGEKQIASALIDIGALWAVVLAFIVLAWPVRRSAALLFVPYLLWLSYAAALNFEIWRLNT